jgi:hypothetical protein
MRFISLQDPVDNWMVYDSVSELPAELAGTILIGLSRDQADFLARKANAPSEPKWPDETVCRLGAASSASRSSIGASGKPNATATMPAGENTSVSV